MFRDFKSGGYSLEGSQLAPQYLSKLIIVIAIAYTSATMQGKKIKDMGIQKYVTRPEKRYKGQRRHSSFYVGQHLYHWLQLNQMFQKNIEELMQISRYRLKDCIKRQRAILLALSTFWLACPPLRSFMRLRQHHTIRYESMIYERVKNCSIEEISREEGLGWEEVQLIFNHCAKELEKEEWEAPERISLDEFSHLKGHKDFITTVVDLDKKILLDVIKGHKQEELMEALKAQPEAVREKVKEVSVDMWGSISPL